MRMLTLTGVDRLLLHYSTTAEALAAHHCTPDTV